MIYHIFLSALFFASLLFAASSFSPAASPPVFTSLGQKPSAPQLPDPFRQARLEAASVYVFDLTDRKTLFEKNEFEIRSLASLSKLMVVLLLEERVPAGIFIPVSAEAVRQEGDSGFRAGEEFKKEDLRDFMLVVSSNDAAYAVAEFVGGALEGNPKARVSKFVGLMNERASALGMRNTSFFNPHGLDQKINHEILSGANASAFEISLLMEYIFTNHPRLIEKTREEKIEIISQEGRKVSAVNINQAISLIPQLISAKTGFTDLAGGNLVFIFDAGFSRPVLVTLLGSSYEGRFSDAQKIVNAVLAYYALQNP